jgi:hypothetical protein
MPGERQGIPPSIVEPSVAYQGETRLQNRDSPGKRFPGRSLRMQARFLSIAEALDVSRQVS